MNQTTLLVPFITLMLQQYFTFYQHLNFKNDAPQRVSDFLHAKPSKIF